MSLRRPRCKIYPRDGEANQLLRDTWTTALGTHGLRFRHAFQIHGINQTDAQHPGPSIPGLGAFIYHAPKVCCLFASLSAFLLPCTTNRLPLLRTPCLHRARQAVLRIFRSLSQSLSLGNFLELAVVAPGVGAGRAVLSLYTYRTFSVLALFLH